ncbi:MAG: hypothetical protein KJ888_20450, partial [Gammaproteobacteria bacterium]|nr:hypothetical protein [Gammaproteobacteria bacterium]
KTLPYLPEDLQAKYQTLPLEDFWTEYEAWAIPQEQKRQEFIDTIAAVFPDVAEGGQETINDWIVKLNTDVGQEDILARLTAKGRSPETENLLTAIGATPEQIDELFQYVEGLAYEPSAGEVATPKEPLVAEVTNVRTGEVIPQSELKARYPKGYEAELDQWVLTPETAKRLPSVISVFGQSLARVPKQLAAAILTAIQPMGASVVDRDWADRKILEATTDQAKFVAEVSEKYKSSGLPVDITDIASLPQNIAYSLTSMGAGLGVGVGVGILPIPGARVAAWVAGTAASGAVAYNMTHYQIVQQYLEAKNDEKIASGKGTLTQDEEDALKAEFESLARQYGLWEAVPEAISNLAFAKLLTAPLGRMVGKSIATRVIGKLAGMYGEELLTETITQKGQSAIEVEVGLRENKITWIEAFKEVAPQTFLLTTLMAGAGQVSISGLTRIRESLQNEIGDKKSLHDIIKNGLVTLVNDETGSIELPGGEQIPPKPEVAKPYNWRQAFNETNDPSRKADILRAVAEVTTVTPKELQDILERVTGLPDEANIRYAVERRQQAIPKAETGMPEAGVQAGAFGVSAKEVRPQGKGKITQISMDEQLKLEQMRKEAETPEDIQNVKAYEKQVQIEGLKDYLKSEPASALTNLAKKLGWYKGEVNNLTLKQYRDLTGKREILPNILTSDKKHVRWEYALDEIATEYGYPDGDALKEAIEQSRETELQIADIEKELIAMPLPEPPVKATTLSRGFYKYLVERDVTDLPVKDVDLWMELFGDALVSEDILKQRAATLELRKIEQAKRAANAEDILQEEYLKTGNLEEAAAKARDIALRGELPKVTSDILSIITEDVRAILFAKIRFHWTQVESEYSFYEENSAIEALTHALDTGDIPRKRGTGTPWFPKGGSQWDRLARVFGKESPVLKALDEGKKPIDDIV